MRITPEAFDLVVVGTGLQEALIASSASLIGKTVLHIDSESDYGDLWGGANLEEFVKCLNRRGDVEESTSPKVFQNVEFVKKDELQLENARDYLIDFAPKLTYAAGPLLALLVKTQCHHYVDYRYLDKCFVLYDGVMIKVPSSRSDVFKDRTLEAGEKRSLTLWLKSAIEVFETGSHTNLDFDSWLDSHHLNDRVKEMIQSAVCFYTGHQNSQQKFESLALALQSADRFKPRTGPFITPYYTSSDIPQAFCRLCAIHGGIYVLNCGIKSISVKQDHSFLVTHFDQEIKFDKLCIPSYLLKIEPNLLTPQMDPDFKERWISRGLCILDKSIMQDSSQVFIVIPEGPVHILQIGAPACPVGKHLLYCFSWSRGKTARDDLESVLHKILSTQQDVGVLLECYWNQRFVQSSNPSSNQDICLTDTPSEIVGYGSEIHAAKQKFEHLFPDQEFLKSVTKLSENIGDDDDEDNDLFADLETELRSQQQQ
eukprot:g5206.t1